MPGGLRFANGIRENLYLSLELPADSRKKIREFRTVFYLDMFWEKSSPNCWLPPKYKT
jgi:hypothetical protein